MICIPSTICPGMHIRHGQLSIIQISSVSDMHTTCSGTHIGHRRYLYNGQLTMSDMHTRADSTWYAYQTQTICVPERVVCILDTEMSMHIIHGQYVYNKFLCISDMDDMCTINIYTHIIHVRYAYQVLPSLVHIFGHG